METLSCGRRLFFWWKGGKSMIQKSDDFKGCGTLNIKQKDEYNHMPKLRAGYILYGS